MESSHRGGEEDDGILAPNGGERKTMTGGNVGSVGAKDIVAFDMNCGKFERMLPSERRCSFVHGDRNKRSGNEKLFIAFSIPEVQTRRREFGRKHEDKITNSAALRERLSVPLIPLHCCPFKQ